MFTSAARRIDDGIIAFGALPLPQKSDRLALVRATDQRSVPALRVTEAAPPAIAG